MTGPAGREREFARERLHYLNGMWTRTPAPTAPGDEVLEPVTLTWIPGTRSLWGAAIELNPKSLKSPGKLLILKYGV